MADEQEKEEILKKEIDDLEEQTLELAEKMEEVAGIDCSFGSCVFEPALDSAEMKIEEVQRRKKALESIMKSLKECDTE